MRPQWLISVMMLLGNQSNITLASLYFPPWCFNILRPLLESRINILRVLLLPFSDYVHLVLYFISLLYSCSFYAQFYRGHLILGLINQVNYELYLMLVVKPEKRVYGTICIYRKITKELLIWSILSNMYPERIIVIVLCIFNVFPILERRTI